MGCVMMGEERKAAGAEEGTALGEWRGEEAMLLQLLLLEREDGADWWVVSSSEERIEYLGLLLSAQNDPGGGGGELRRGTRGRVRSLRASSGAVVTRHQGRTYDSMSLRSNSHAACSLKQRSASFVR